MSRLLLGRQQLKCNVKLFYFTFYYHSLHVFSCVRQPFFYQEIDLHWPRSYARRCEAKQIRLHKFKCLETSEEASLNKCCIAWMTDRFFVSLSSRLYSSGRAKVLRMREKLEVIVPGTAVIRRRRQSMKPQVEVKSMNYRPAADCAPCRRRR